jgi:hypothetical protein
MWQLVGKALVNWSNIHWKKIAAGVAIAGGKKYNGKKNPRSSARESVSLAQSLGHRPLPALARFRPAGGFPMPERV